MHIDWPIVAEYLPGGHCQHNELPTVALYFAASQAAQTKPPPSTVELSDPSALTQTWPRPGMPRAPLQPFEVLCQLCRQHMPVPHHEQGPC